MGVLELLSRCMYGTMTQEQEHKYEKIDEHITEFMLSAERRLRTEQIPST